MTKALLQNEKNKIWNVFGEQIICKISSDETCGRFTIVEESSPPDSVVPPHFHRQTDEIIYVLEGGYEMQIDGKMLDAKAGDTVFIRRGSVHTFRNVSNKTSRILAVITPSGFENFFAEIDKLPPGEMPEIEKIAEIGQRNDLELVI